MGFKIKFCIFLYVIILPVFSLFPDILGQTLFEELPYKEWVESSLQTKEKTKIFETDYPSSPYLGLIWTLDGMRKKNEEYLVRAVAQLTPPINDYFNEVRSKAAIELAKLYAKDGKFTLSLNRARQAKRFSKKSQIHDECKLLESQYFIHNKQFKTALKYLDGIKSEPLLFDRLKYLAMCHEALGSFTQAKICTEQAFLSLPDVNDLDNLLFFITMKKYLPRDQQVLKWINRWIHTAKEPLVRKKAMEFRVYLFSLLERVDLAQHQQLQLQWTEHGTSF